MSGGMQMKDAHDLVRKQKDFFLTGKTKNIEYRIKALQDLKESIKENESKITDALKKDLNKSDFEAYTTEIGYVLEEIRFFLKNLRSWAKPKRVKSSWFQIGSVNTVYSDPYGTALILSPWNYPFQLAIAPLIGAIGAGNCAVIKPSEMSLKTSEVLEDIIKKLYPEEYIAVVPGDIDTGQDLLEEPFDKIFFTGSERVGKIVMEKAARHLTPVTLELGGKSPCIVHEDAKIRLAAKRIVWGKFINAGQTCIAPDYVYVHRNVRDLFLEELKKAVFDLYGASPVKNPHYTRIVNRKHFQRLTGYLNEGEIILGGSFDEERLVIEPTVLTGITWEHHVMHEEIFGPVLPVMEYDSLTEVFNGILRHPDPLALYLFTESSAVEKEVLSNVSFGGGCINDTIFHVTSPYLPFGGVGKSGMGYYHGKASFDAFSHKKIILKQTTLFDIPFRYSTGKKGLKLIKRLYG
jgi:aldehyde dehydrogenase (NAD+)